MNVEGNGAPIRFKVDYSNLIKQQIVALKIRAIEIGLKHEFDRAYHIILERLIADPSGFGEYVGRFEHLGLLVHVGSVIPLRVEFAFHPTMHFVIVRKVAIIGE